MGFSEFEDADVVKAIRRLSTERSLTLIVGAGASVESGLPNWRDLVRNLLKQAASNRGLSDEASIDGFADWTLSREDVTGAGGIARELLGRRFRSALRRSLYSDKPSPIPGETARAIAALMLDHVGSSRALVTTNYDELLRRAMEEELHSRGMDDVEIRRIARREEVNDDPGLSVTHLHGVLTPNNTLHGELVLSDRDYHLMQDSSAWQEHLLGKHLQSRSCLFVGTSLTDPNLLRYIFRADPGRDHFAVFARQQDADLYDAASEDVVALREESQKQKWQAVGVTPILLDYYSESAQFMWEVVAASALGDNYEPLPNRMKRWRDQLDQTVLTTASAAFVQNQNELHERVKDTFEITLGLLRNNGHRRGPNERLGMSLWIYDPESDALTNWASSDRVWRDPATLEPVAIDWASDFVATQAFCSGSLVSQSTSKYVTSRWNHVIGFPVYVHEETGRLPVGSVTLASTKPQDASLLSRAGDQVRRSIPELEDLMSQLLSPLRDVGKA